MKFGVTTITSPLGVLLDCHIEFAENGRGGPIVIKKNDVFRVVE